MMTSMVVSAADAGYFPLLNDLIDSLDAVMGDERPALGLFDLGLTEDQRRWLSDRGAVLARPDWGFDSPQLAGKPETYKALTARAWLPDYFDAELLLWIDADIWLQTRGAVDWALAGARGGTKIAIAQELHPAYRRNYDAGELLGKYGWFSKYFGDAVATQIGLTPSINVGLFALHRDAPHWQHWRDAMTRILTIEAGPSLEQVALDYAVHAQKLDVAWLPAAANWVAHQALPVWNDGRLCDPVAPHDEISALHLTLATKDMNFTLARGDGGTDPVRTGLRYSDINRRTT